MKEICLAQLEKSDLSRVREFFNYGFKRYLDEYKDYSREEIECWFEQLRDKDNTIAFAIRGSQDIYKDFLVGICALKNIDWVARHAEIFFMMVDKDGHKATIHNRPATKQALNLLLDFAFEEINLNKVWIEVYEHNDVKSVLEDFGFVAEGVRKEVLFKEGRFLDSIICSLLAAERV